MKTDYLIIGNSAGGIGAMEAIRQVDAEGSITVVSDEAYPAYSRPLISEYLAGERDIEGMLFRPLDFYERLQVETILVNGVVRLDLGHRVVQLSDRQEISYGNLLLATGGCPIVPPIEGSNRPGVFTFTTIGHAEGISLCIAKGARRAVVIGGGLIGISVADALRKLNVEVVIVELMDRILGAVLDEQASQMAAKNLTAAGVDLRTGRTVKTIVGMGADEDAPVGGVILDDGESIPCDFVIVAIGVIPRTELVKGTDIKVNRGILVDRHMETSHPGVYACGDVAESYDFIYETDRVVPIWPNAHIGGRVAGFNMAGKKAEYQGGTAMNSLKYFGMPIASAGMVNANGDSGCEVLALAENGRYQKFVIRDERLVGMVMVGDIERAGVYFGMMRDAVNIADIKDSLLSDEFGLINLPEQWLKKRLELPDLSRLHVFHEPEVYEERNERP